LTQKRLVEAQEEKLLLDHKIRTIEEELAKMRFKSKSTLGEMETRGQTKATSRTLVFWRFLFQANAIRP
jgi:hypothetical protein